MATYAIGDIQGCFEPLIRLLDFIQFNPAEDTLWQTGDLVNRGPASLEVLRFMRALGDKHQIVLGNHDLHLLAVDAGARKQSEGDTLDETLYAPDKEELLDWLRHRPLLVQHESLPFIMTHAGIAPMWTVEKAAKLAQEVEMILRAKKIEKEFYEKMYGNQPDLWRDDLTGMDRLRCIINYFTRMRFCNPEGRLNLANKGTLQSADENWLPWYAVNPELHAKINIIFGHWAALQGESHQENIIALDTGCVWGFELTAMRLEDGKKFNVPAQ